MIQLRPASKRGKTKLDWLDSRHSFSFGDYYDPLHMGFRHLRVINEDRVEGGKGFGMHSHRDMEIVTWVLEGALEHKDSLGNGSVIRPGDLQRMSAGRGIQHSEFNQSKTEKVHFLQIWIEPWEKGLPPGYEQKSFSFPKSGGWTLLGSSDGREDSVTVNQDIKLWAARLNAGRELSHTFAEGRSGWLQVARGVVEIGKQRMESGDGAELTGEKEMVIRSVEAAEVLLFEMR